MAGEALALALGMHLLSPDGNPWVSRKNDLFLVLYVIIGVGLVIVAIVNREALGLGILYVLLVVAALAHSYREWEVLVRASNAFCANRPLFVVNTAKLGGLLAIAVSALGRAA
jgi:hypothetical protein